MQVEHLILGPFMVNCYIVGDPASGDAVIIDAGDAGEKIIQRVESLDLKPVCLANTHAHIDHTSAVKAVVDHFGVGFFLHKADEPVLNGLSVQAGMFGVHYSGVPVISGYLEDGEVLEAGTISLDIIHTPGHSPGSISLYAPEESILFCGDTLFAGSIGRTDLPGGSYEQEIRSIKEKLLCLPDDTKVYTGHGPVTTIGDEKRTNPFLRSTIF